jgi:hypothetical protein
LELLRLERATGALRYTRDVELPAEILWEVQYLPDDGLLLLAWGSAEVLNFRVNQVDPSLLVCFHLELADGGDVDCI